MNKEEIEYLVGMGYDVLSAEAHSIEKAESKGASRTKFFKVDDEGFIYTTYERPNHIIERDDYDE